MFEFEKLKTSYTLTIQIGLSANVGYHEANRGNEILHKFCENLIDNSNCTDQEKTAMKSELKLLKEALSKEIEHHYEKDQCV